MLDAASTFDRLVHEQTSNAKQAEAILQNPVYRAISGSLSGAQEYMAIERLHQLHTSGEWDLVIVDTPPSRHAIDLLEAPDRLIGFLSHPVYRTLTAGQRAFARVTNAAASMFLWAVRRLAGPQIVEDTVEFSGHLPTSNRDFVGAPVRSRSCCGRTRRRSSSCRAAGLRRSASRSISSGPSVRAASRSAVSWST